jgi:hypothetical protein
MRKVLCTSIALLLILGGFAAGSATQAFHGIVADAEAVTGTALDTTAAGLTAAATGTAVTTTGSAADVTTGAAAEADPAAGATGAAVTAPTDAAIGTTDSAVTTDTAILPDASNTADSGMAFTGTPVKLSLEDAYKKMLADSPQAEVATLNKQRIDGIAKGYGETASLLNKSKEAGGDYSTTDKNILKIQQQFAATQGSRDYEAEINSLKSDTLSNYYKLKELENQVQIAKDNLALKEKLLSNTQLKFKLGTVSKSDVLKAEASVYEAKDGVLAAQNGLIQMKMGFNQFLGYDLMQDVVLTDTIKEVALPQKSLAASIKDALANRNEILEANYNVEISTLNMKNYEAYPRSSSKYTKAKMSMLLAETSKKNAPLTVESDVRTKYLAVNQKYSAIQTSKKSVDNAKESVRLVQLQYDAGMATLSDVEGLQLSLYNAQLEYSKALLEYNLAVNDYELAGTVGTSTSSLSKAQ